LAEYGGLPFWHFSTITAIVMLTLTATVTYFAVYDSD